MTESKWLAAKSADSLIDHLVYRVSRVFAHRRKLRLVAAACARLMLPALPDDPALSAIIDAAERYADDPAARPDAVAARKPLRQAAKRLSPGEVAEPLKKGAVILVELTDDALEAHTAAIANSAWVMAHAKAVVRTPSSEAKARQADIVRCVFGNTFRAAVVDAAQRTPTVVSLAQAAYEERKLPSGELDAVRLAVLADALEEAGAAEEVVSHLRSPGSHVRGCWVVDQALGKE